MKHLHIFETYKAQKEMELLTSLLITKLADETYEWHNNFVWKEPREGNHYEIEDKTYRVYFKNKTNGFTDGALYVIDRYNGSQISFKGYNKIFKPDEVKLEWSDVNKYKFKNFIGTSVTSAAKGKMERFDELKDFINDTYIIYKLKPQGTDSIKGFVSYRTNNKNMSIIIKYPKNLLNELSKSKRLEFKGDRSDMYSSEDIKFQISTLLYGTTLHELQHAYDIYRSGGKAMQTQDDKYKFQQVKASYLRDKEELEEEEREYLKKLSKKYLNFPHEINARFTQAVQNINFSKLIKDSGGNYITVMETLSHIVMSFKLYFYGWNVLTEKSKRSLIRKVSQFWHLEKDRIELRNKKRPTLTNESATQIAYHVTSKSNLESIMKNGLEAIVPEDFGEHGDTKGVYLFKTIDDAKTALTQWLGERIDDIEEERGEPYDEVLLHINITGLDCLDTVEFEWTCLDNIPADRIIHIDYTI